MSDMAIPGIDLASSPGVLMILWHLRGSSSEFVCSIEKGRVGYRLVIQSASTVIINDVLPDVRRARWKADLIRSELLAMGYTAPA
jgi:hypothetical protein